MKINQRDIVEVNFVFPDGTTKPHMAVVVSNDELQEVEEFFYLAMISSKNYNPQYTFELKDTMVTKPLSKKSYVVCQLIGGYTESDVVRKFGSIKLADFERLLEKIKTTIF